MELSRFTPSRGSAGMDANKDSEPKAEFSDDKSYSFVGKKASRKTKIIILSILTVVLLLGAVVSVSVYFALRKTNPTEPTPTRLVEVNLEEGETLTYEVDQQIEITGNNKQKATIRSLVGIRVLNKTSEGYWFLMKFNLSYLDGNVDLRAVKKVIDYFLVRLETDSRRSNHANKKPSASFEVYGHRHTHEELLRLVYGILEQLLPTVEHELYEEVDGEKRSDSSSLDPEDSPLLPGSVQMHRKANTSDKNAVYIKNDFDRTHFVNGLPAEMDLDLKYSDFASINKSNGMVTKSHSHFAQQLNFGEPIHSNGGFNISMMKITLTSHVSLIESNFFGSVQSERVNFRFFVKLVVPKSKATFSVNEKPHRVSSNSTQTPLNISSPSRQRRSASAVPWKKAGPLSLNVEHPFTVFEKKVIGLNVKGEGMVWLEEGDDMEIGVCFGVSIGGGKVRNIFHERYQRNQLEDGLDLSKELPPFGIGIPFSVPVLYIISVGVEFSLDVQVKIQLRFPPDENSLSPVKLAVEIEPSAEVTASITGYVSALIIQAGVYGDGTLVRVGLPVTLSYQAVRSPGSQWCMNVSIRLTALELSAGLYYQWRFVFWRGKRHILYEFGKWAAIKRNWDELDRCS